MPKSRVVIGALFCVIWSFAPACEDMGNDFGEQVGGTRFLAGEDGHGLKGTYFNNMDFTSQVFERVDPVVDFEWGRDAPDSKMGSETFSVRWTGFVKPKYSETYTLYTVGDDGIRLYVDGKLVVNDWSNHGPRERSGTISLAAGKLYPIKLEHYEDSGGAVAKLLWSSSSQTKQIIPEAQLFQTENQSGEGVAGEMSNVALGKPATQSSIGYWGEASRAVDGNTSGQYGDESVSHTAHEATPWWRVDLGGAFSVKSVTIYNRTDCCGQRLSDFHVDYLDEAGNVVATRDYQSEAATKTEIDISASGVYSVRVQLYGTNFLSLAEVQVFGFSGTGSEIDTGTQMCVQANEHQTASLSCPGAGKITSIDFASFGLPEGSCDVGFDVAASCHASSSKDEVEDACLNQNSCMVTASNSVFGDPCSGKFKNLAIIYTCGSGATEIGDLCPADPNKTVPGECGCGVPEGTCGGGSTGTGKITHVGTNEIWDGDGQNIKIARPSGSKAGDLLILVLHRTDDDLPLYVDDWTRVAECYKRDNGYDCSVEEDCVSWHNDDFCGDFGGHGGHDLAQSIFYRKVSSSEPSSYTFNLNRDSSGHPGWVILTALRGAATSDPVRDWDNVGCDGSADSIFPSVYGVSGDMVLLSQSFDDKIAQAKFGAPTGTSTFGYVANSDESGFLFGGLLSKTGETGTMKTQGDGGPACKDALVSLTIKPQ